MWLQAIKQKTSMFLEDRHPEIFFRLRRVFWRARNRNAWLLRKKRKIVQRYTDTPFYLNIGGFIFLKDHWRVLEYSSASYPISKGLIDFDVDLSVEKIFPIQDGTCDIIYTSHTLEHVPIKNVRFCLKEMRRILKENGILRIVVPDADLACDAYEKNDREFFKTYKKIFASGGAERDRTLEDYLLEWFTIKEVNPKDGPESIRRQYYALGREKFLSENETGMLFEGHDHRRHVTWFTFERLKMLLVDQQFRHVRRSGYLQSQSSELRDEKYFDPLPRLSLYVEATK